MDLGEYIFMRIFLVFFFGAVIFGIRLIFALIKKGIGKLTGSREEEPGIPQVQQPPKPPVIPGQSCQPPVVSQVSGHSGTDKIVTTPIGNLPPEHMQWMNQMYAPLQLRVMNGVLAGKTCQLTSAGEAMTCTIGRHPANTLQFPPDAPGISGNHCRVMYESFTGNRVIRLMDCGSTYGTYLENGQRLTPNQTVQLSPGDTFYLAGRNGAAIKLEYREMI